MSAFDELAWHSACHSQLSQQAMSGRLPHALLLHAVRGHGSAGFSRDLAQGLLCGEAEGLAYCDNCPGCNYFRAGTHPDFALLSPPEGKNIIPIDDVREMIHSLSLTPAIASQKVALIQPADHLNISSANALLKTLEEPLGHVTLILLSYDPSRLLATIRSRCQLFQTGVASPKESLDWLKKRFPDRESQEIEEALSASRQAPLAAAEYLESELPAQRQQVRKDLQALVRGQAKPLGTAKSWAGIPAKELWAWLSEWSLNLAKKQITADTPVRGIHLSGKILLDLSRRAMENWRLVDTPVRQDLLITQWLQDWTGQ